MVVGISIIIRIFMHVLILYSLIAGPIPSSTFHLGLDIVPALEDTLLW